MEDDLPCETEEVVVYNKKNIVKIKCYDVKGLNKQFMDY